MRMKRSQRIIALREKRETERRLNKKVKAQVKFDKRLSLLFKEEETLPLEERRFRDETEAQSTPKLKVKLQVASDSMMAPT